MTDQQPLGLADLDERTWQAIEEIKSIILQQYPRTTFVVERAPDDPASIHLVAVTDVDDPDEVGDLVVDRIVALQVEEGIPLHVIPLRTPERIRAVLEGERDQAAGRLQRAGRLRRMLA